jgi:hypothetical protein
MRDTPQSAVQGQQRELSYMFAIIDASQESTTNKIWNMGEQKVKTLRPMTRRRMNGWIKEEEAVEEEEVLVVMVWWW